MTGTCDTCSEPMHGNRKGDCPTCRRHAAEWAAMTPAERAAELAMIDAYVAESEGV